MRLKKLTIFGFKSFADKVTLDFDCEIIGVVGPNGCGKSNIVDAFRWVMGEQSAKSLRGDKMHDVLFAGADKRKPINYAEVSVTLDEINGQLPLPYEEITITRRLYRDGESEYFINKELVRLKDIQSLFLGSGIGKNAFSIFEQGKLDQIIHLSPLERRAIFDEAAGTSRFLQRKKETMRKLTTVTENYSRVRDVHAEIEKQTKQLKKQAGHAKHFQENQHKLQDLEKNAFLLRWNIIVEKNAEIEAKAQTLQSSIQEEKTAQCALEEKLNRAKQHLSAEELLVKHQQKEYHVCETNLRVSEAEIVQQKHHLLEIKKRQQTIQSQLQILSKEQQARWEEIKQKESGPFSETNIVELKESVKVKRDAHLHSLKQEGLLRAELQEKTFHYEAKKSRLHTIKDLENKVLNLIKEAEKQVKTHRDKVSELTTQIDVFKIELEDLEKELHTTRTNLTEAQKEEQAYVRQITEVQGQQKALNRLKESMEGYSTGAQALLKEAKNAKSVLFQKIEPLVEYLNPDKGFEEVLASALRGYTDTLVVGTEEAFNELLAFAEKKQISDFSVIVKSKLLKNKHAAKATLAAHLEDNAVATHFTEGFVVKADGNFYDPLGVFFHLKSGKKVNNTFYRHAELKALSETLNALQAKAQAAQLRVQQLSDQLKQIEKKRHDVIEVRRKKEMDLIQANFTLQKALADLEQNKLEIEALNTEKKQLSSLEDIYEQIESLKVQVATCAAQTVSLAAALQKEESWLESWQKLHHDIQILKAKHQQSATHEKKMMEEIEEIHAGVETTIKTIAARELELDLQKQKLASLRAELTSKEKSLLEAKRECEIYDKELGQKRKKIESIEKEKHSCDIVLAQDTSEKKALEQSLQQKHSLAPDILHTQVVTLECSLEEALKEMQRLRASLDAAGAVNMTAIEEFQQTQARFDYLDQQLKDLEDSKKDLEEVIARLDQECRKIFKKTFAQIRENFQKNFAILFNGGSADLTFTESTDILEAGVEIIAKPPGKQMRAISLLSGGEKCLTALALLFSIFEVKPAPFCILDEVDAPLDDRNIDRFTQVLKQFIDKTQFIIVTHNKKTMAIADLLIGVSMEEKGVSKLISLAFEKRTQRALL